MSHPHPRRGAHRRGTPATRSRGRLARMLLAAVLGATALSAVSASPATAAPSLKTVRVHVTRAKKALNGSLGHLRAKKRAQTGLSRVRSESGAAHRAAVALWKRSHRRTARARAAQGLRLLASSQGQQANRLGAALRSAPTDLQPLIAKLIADSIQTEQDAINLLKAAISQLPASVQAEIGALISAEPGSAGPLASDLEGDSLDCDVSGDVSGALNDLVSGIQDNLSYLAPLIAKLPPDVQKQVQDFITSLPTQLADLQKQLAAATGCSSDGSGGADDTSGEGSSSGPGDSSGSDDGSGYSDDGSGYAHDGSGPGDGSGPPALPPKPPNHPTGRVPGLSAIWAIIADAQKLAGDAGHLAPGAPGTGSPWGSGPGPGSGSGPGPDSPGGPGS